MEILHEESKLLLEETKTTKRYLIKSLGEYKVIAIWNSDGEVYDCSEHYNIKMQDGIIGIIDKSFCWDQKAFIYSIERKKLYTIYRHNWEGVNIMLFKENENYFNPAKGIKLIQNYKNDINNYNMGEINSFIKAVETYGDTTITGEPGYPSYKEK